MEAVVFCLALFGCFAYLVALDTSHLLIIPLSNCSHPSNSCSTNTGVKEILAGTNEGNIARSRMLIHCILEKKAPLVGSSFFCNNKKSVNPRSYETKGDCPCHLYLLEGLFSEKRKRETDLVNTSHVTPSSGYFTWLTTIRLTWVQVKILVWSLIYLTIFVCVIEVMMERRSFNRAIAEDNLSRGKTSDASDTTTTASQSTDIMEDVRMDASYHEYAIDMCFYQLHGSDSSTSCSSTSSRHGKLASSSSESEIEISQLEKLLASGSAVILRGNYSVSVPATRPRSTIETSSSSFVHFVGDGLGEIYQDQQPRKLLTRSSPGAVQRPYHLYDRIFWNPPSSNHMDSWLKVQSLPNIHQVCQSMETRKKSTVVKTQSEQCDVNTPCSFTGLHREASYEQRTQPLIWASMHNVGTCSNYFSGGAYRSLPCIFPSWMLSNLAIFSGFTQEESKSTSVCEGNMGNNGFTNNQQMLVGPRHFNVIPGEARENHCDGCGCGEVDKKKYFKSTDEVEKIYIR